MALRMWDRWSDLGDVDMGTFIIEFHRISKGLLDDLLYSSLR